MHSRLIDIARYGACDVSEQPDATPRSLTYALVVVLALAGMLAGLAVRWAL